MTHAHGPLTKLIAPRSPFYQGPFGRLCRELPGWAPEGVPDHELDRFFLQFANDNMIEAPGRTPAEIAADPQLREQLEETFGSNLPAGYTYFGQFIDHDITFDPASSLMRRNDPNALRNFRTPRLDLDCVYGRGPDDSPYLYDAKDPAKFLIGSIAGSNLRDLPRNAQGRALIGDKRNDENSIVSQLQLGFLLAHNSLVDRARLLQLPNPFEAARRTLRWLYQWVVWNDFVRRIASNQVHDCALKLVDACHGRKRWDSELTDIYDWRNQPFMPVEFSVAAYRFGHSLVRNEYQTNDPHRGFGNFAPIFDNSGGGMPDDLRGFRPMTEANVIQWDWFLQMTSSGGPFPQRARKIDTKLANALAFLAEGPAGSPMNVLAFRNLKRGFTFDLPSGTDVARKWCINPIALDPATDLDALWYYVLKEAETLPGANAGQMLGRVGSTIVCATFAGLLRGDPQSFLNLQPCWTPDDDPLLCSGTDNVDSGGDGSWELSAIIRIAGLPADAGDVTNQTNGQLPDTSGCVAATP